MGTIQQAFNYQGNQILKNKKNIEAIQTTSLLTLPDIENYLSSKQYLKQPDLDLRYQAKGDYLTRMNIINGYYNKTEIDARLTGLLNDYYTKKQVEDFVALNGGNVDLTDFYTKLEVDSKIEAIKAPNLQNYYNKQDVDNRLTGITANYLSKIEAEAMYQLTSEIATDYVNKTTTDIQDIKGTVASPKFINNSGNLPVGNSNELATTEYVDSKVGSGGTGNFVETNYFSDNAKLLTRNDKVSAETAKIGEEYKGNIEIGKEAEGTQNYGLQAKGIQNYGFQAKNTITLGQEASTDIDIGNQTTGNLFIGYLSTGALSIGQFSTGALYIGRRATGTLNIGAQAEGLQQYGFQAKNTISVGNEASGNIDIGTRASGGLNIGAYSTNNLNIGTFSAANINIGGFSTATLSIGSSKWGTPQAPNTNGYLVSGNTNSTFRETIDKANEKVDSFVATGNTAAPLGTINDSTSQFFNGGTINTGNTVKLDFIDTNYTFTENINPGFSLIRNDTKKLDIGQSNKRVFIKVGVIINSFSGASVGQLEIALKSGSIDIGTDSIVLINPNPNAFFVKTIGVLNSDLVKQEGISISLTSQNGNFVIGGLEVILL